MVGPQINKIFESSDLFPLQQFISYIYLAKMIPIRFHPSPQQPANSFQPPKYPQQNTQNKLQVPKHRASHRTTLDIDNTLINEALRRSYTRQLAGGQEKVKVEEMFQGLANFALQFIEQEQQDTEEQLEQFWCIVGLNQQSLHKSEENFCSCSSSALEGDLSKLQLYQLFIGLGKKQLRFQSLSNPKKFYILNMDTISSVLAFSDVKQSHSNNHIRQEHQLCRVIAEDKHDFDFYFTVQTLPFRARQIYSQQQCLKICGDIAKHTENIIKQAAQESKGKLYSLTSKELPDEDFLQVRQPISQHRYATEQQFSRYCQTGDIILFRDNHTFAKIQRFFTNSQCDHIGMIFRDQRYGICIFQSNSGTGVSLAMWNQLIRYKWFQNIEGIYWRRLNMQNKPEDFEEKVKDFIQKNLHKEYGISLSKLFRSKDVTYNDPQAQKNQTYFCSELVAAIYKYLNLLEPNKPSSTYIPKDFTDKGSLEMINNTALEAERRLIFNEKVLKETYKFYR